MFFFLITWMSTSLSAGSMLLILHKLMKELRISKKKTKQQHKNKNLLATEEKTFNNRLKFWKSNMISGLLG